MNLNVILTRHSTPFDYYIAEEAIPADEIAELSATWDRVFRLTRRVASRPGGDKVYTMNHLSVISAGKEDAMATDLPSAWRALCLTLSGAPFSGVIGEQVGVDLSGDSVDVGIYVHQPGDSVTVHKDKPHKSLSCILYLNPSWQREFGGEFCLYEATDLERPCTRVSPLAGQMLLFQPGERSWHSVAPVGAQAPLRRTIQVEYVRG